MLEKLIYILLPSIVQAIMATPFSPCHMLEGQYGRRCPCNILQVAPDCWGDQQTGHLRFPELTQEPLHIRPLPTWDNHEETCYCQQHGTLFKSLHGFSGAHSLQVRSSTEPFPWGTHIEVSADEPQDHVYTDEGARPPNACTAVGDDGSRLVHMPHVGDEGEQIIGLGGGVVVRPGDEVQVENVPHFTCLRFKNNTTVW